MPPVLSSLSAPIQAALLSCLETCQLAFAFASWFLLPGQEGNMEPTSHEHCQQVFRAIDTAQPPQPLTVPLPTTHCTPTQPLIVASGVSPSLSPLSPFSRLTSPEQQSEIIPPSPPLPPSITSPLQQTPLPPTPRAQREPSLKQVLQRESLCFRLAHLQHPLPKSKPTMAPRPPQHFPQRELPPPPASVPSTMSQIAQPPFINATHVSYR
jgi:hypothetical protein